jgi:hypothetical protein
MDWLELINKIIVIIGLPLGLYRYIITKQKEKRDREYGTYDALDDKFIEFQKLCLDHPELNTFDVPDKTPKQLTEKEKKEELILFTILFSIFERAYILYNLYNKTDQKIKNDQWKGWNDYIQSYSQRNNFVQAWKESGTTFDANFENFMGEILKS